MRHSVVLLPEALRVGDQVFAYVSHWRHCVIQTIKRGRSVSDAIVDDGTRRTWRRLEELIPVVLLAGGAPRSLGRGMARVQAREFWRQIRRWETLRISVVDSASL